MLCEHNQKTYLDRVPLLVIIFWRFGNTDYAIGVAQPVSIFINTNGTSNLGLTDGEIAKKVSEIFDLRPAKIIEKFELKYPIFEATASYGHFGREPYTQEVELVENGNKVTKEVTFFAWEKLDAVEKIKAAFGC